MSGWCSVFQHCIEYVRTRPLWRPCCKCESGAIKFRKERIPAGYVARYRERAVDRADVQAASRLSPGPNSNLILRTKAEADGVGAMLASLCAINNLDPSKVEDLTKPGVVKEMIDVVANDIGVDPADEGYFMHRVGREQYVSQKLANKALTELGYTVSGAPGRLSDSKELEGTS